MNARSYLYVPGDQPDKLAKADERGADALIVDLEDSVPLARKAEARAILAGWLGARGERDPPVWVRVSSGAMLADDIAAIADASIAGVSLAKATLDGLARLDRLLDARGLAVIALMETADAILGARAIAEHPRVVRLAIGEADLAAELAIETSSDGREMWFARQTVVLASAAAGIESPVGPVSTEFRDQAALRTTTETLRRMGFGARAAIHPAQVAIINEAFTPSADEVDAAQRIIERFAAAGGAACTDDDGRMIDEAIVRSARRVLDRDR